MIPSSFKFKILALRRIYVTKHLRVNNCCCATASIEAEWRSKMADTGTQPKASLLEPTLFVYCCYISFSLLYIYIYMLIMYFYLGELGTHFTISISNIFSLKYFQSRCRSYLFIFVHEIFLFNVN